jgi:hypothetical protein
VDSHDSPRALLRHVRDQYFSSLPLETLGFDDIKKHCTDWPDTVLDYGCGTVYQNFEMRPESQIIDQRIRLNHLKPQAAPIPEPHQHDTSLTRQFTGRTPIHDIDMSGVSEPDGLHLRVSVGANPRVIDVAKAEGTLHELCEEIQALNATLQQPVPHST